MKKVILLSLCAVAFFLSAQESFNEKRYIEEGRQLERAQKRKEAFQHYNEGLKKNLSPAARRMFLNRCAMLSVGNKVKREYLFQACMIKGGDPTEVYRTNQLLGYTFMKESPDRAVGYLLNFQNKSRIHKALVYNGYFYAGRLMERQKKFDAALEYYREALAAGKSVTYKFNYSAAEKSIEKIEKIMKKSK